MRENELMAWLSGRAESTHLMSCRVRLIPCCFPGGVLWGVGVTLLTHEEWAWASSREISYPYYFSLWLDPPLLSRCVPASGVTTTTTSKYYYYLISKKGKSSQKVCQKTTLVFLFVRRRYCHATWARNGAIDLIIQGGQSNRRITVEKSKNQKKEEEARRRERRKTMSRRTTVGTGGSFTAVWIFLQERLTSTRVLYNVKI